MFAFEFKRVATTGDSRWFPCSVALFHVVSHSCLWPGSMFAPVSNMSSKGWLLLWRSGTGRVWKNMTDHTPQFLHVKESETLALNNVAYYCNHPEIYVQESTRIYSVLMLWQSLLNVMLAHCLKECDFLQLLWPEYRGLRAKRCIFQWNEKFSGLFSLLRDSSCPSSSSFALRGSLWPLCSDPCSSSSHWRLVFSKAPPKSTANREKAWKGMICLRV